MITRQRGGPLEPLNLEIEATARRNRGRNRREELRRRIETEDMEGDDRVNPELQGVVNENLENLELEREAQGRGRQEEQNGQGGNLPPLHVQGGGGPQQGGYNQGPYGNAQGYYPHPQYPHPPFYQPPPPQAQYPPYMPPAQEPNPRPQEGRPIRAFLEPQVREYYDGIARPNVGANNFEINTGMIRLLMTNQFDGRNEGEDPYQHLERFLELADTFKQNGVSEDAKKLRMFSFTLTGKAKLWLTKTVPPGSVSTWDEVSRKFLLKFYPPARTLQARNEIHNFKQKVGESIKDAWERFNNLLLSCSQHGFTEESTMCSFFSGLDEGSRLHLNACAGGAFLELSTERCARILDEIACL